MYNSDRSIASIVQYSFHFIDEELVKAKYFWFTPPRKEQSRKVGVEAVYFTENGFVIKKEGDDFLIPSIDSIKTEAEVLLKNAKQLLRH